MYVCVGGSLFTFTTLEVGRIVVALLFLDTRSPSQLQTRSWRRALAALTCRQSPSEQNGDSARPAIQRAPGSGLQRLRTLLP